MLSRLARGAWIETGMFLPSLEDVKVALRKGGVD